MKIIDESSSLYNRKEIVIETVEDEEIDQTNIAISDRHKAMVKQLRAKIDLSGMSLEQIDAKTSVRFGHRYITLWQFSFKPSKQ